MITVQKNLGSLWLKPTGGCLLLIESNLFIRYVINKFAEIDLTYDK